MVAEDGCDKWCRRKVERKTGEDFNIKVANHNSYFEFAINTITVSFSQQVPGTQQEKNMPCTTAESEQISGERPT